MKRMTKQIMLIILSLLLLLIIALGAVIYNRVSGVLGLFLGLTSNNTPTTAPTTSASGNPSSPSAPSVPTESTQPHEHYFVKESTRRPTCTDLGYTIYVCSCGKNDLRDMKDALGHRLGEATVVPATCETDGYTEQFCSRCEKHIRSDLVEAGHSFSEWGQADPAFGVPNSQQQRTCSACNTVELHNNDTPGEWILRRIPLESEGGYIRYKLIVDFPEEEKADPSYDVYIRLENPIVYYTYDENGLHLYYLVGPETIIRTAPGSGNNVIVLEADGTLSNIKPDIPVEDPSEPSEPVDPSEPIEPSEPTDPSDPITPSESE
ncbi:MAG: hypothetical protein E7454_03835 [Ruminococcaceae bacterium]|nr:hypothetical protein [Oscillospiraceae bacterium]